MALHSYLEAERSNTASSTASPCEIGSSPIDMDALSYSETYSSSLISWSHIASSTASLFDMSSLSINLDALPDSETCLFSSLNLSSNTATSTASTCGISVFDALSYSETNSGIRLISSSNTASFTASSCDMSSLLMDIDSFPDSETDSCSRITSAFSQVASDHNENAVMKFPLPLDALSGSETNSGISLISSSDTASFTASSYDMSTISMGMDSFPDSETDSCSSIFSSFSQVALDHNENAVMKFPLPLDALSGSETNSGISLISSSDTASFTASSYDMSTISMGMDSFPDSETDSCSSIFSSFSQVASDHNENAMMKSPLQNDKALNVNISDKSEENLIGTMNVSVTKSSDDSAKSESGHSFSSKPRANSNDKGILNENSAPQIREEFVRKCVKSNTNSKKSDAMTDGETKLESELTHSDSIEFSSNNKQGILDNKQSSLLEKENSEKSNIDSKLNCKENERKVFLSKKQGSSSAQETHILHMFYMKQAALQMIPDSIPSQTDNSSSESITERIRENYKCINCKEDIYKKECDCISRSISLPNGDISRLCESLLHIIEEMDALMRVWIEKKDIKKVRKKLKKMTRNGEKQQPLICRGKEGKKHYRCYSCHEAKGACTVCNHCSCKKLSIQIPFSIWANDLMTRTEKEKYFESKYIEAFSKQIGK